MASLQDRGWKPTSANQVHRSLIQFWKFCQDEGEIERSPMQNIKAPRIPETTHPTVRKDDLKAIVRAIQGHTLAAKRDKAILYLLFDSGMRLRELAGMRMDKLDLKNGRVLVTGKGSHEREAPFGHSTALYLDRYLRERDRWLHEGRRSRYAAAGGRHWLYSNHSANSN